MRPEIEQAVALLHSQRPDALERALDLLQNTVFSFSMKVCGHREDAEDTMQDVLLKAVPYLPKFDSPKALVVWLYTVAKNRCLMSRRRSKFAPKETLSLEELMPDRQELEALAHDGDHGTPETSALRRESSDLVRQAVLKVPPQYRLILVLHDMEELDTPEIARITGLRPGTVRVRLHRARLFVRNELARGKTRRARPHKPRRPQPCKALFASLSDYIDGTLQDEMCRELQKHIADCPPCTAFVETLRATIERTRQLAPTKPDPATAARIRKTILQQYRAALAASGKRKVETHS